MGSDDYRQIITDEFGARQARNPQYSLRAFSRDLNVPPDQLCAILNRRYGLSRQRAETMAHRLGLSDGEAMVFCNLVEAEHGRSRLARASAKAKLGELPAAELSMDAFKLVADWQHFAILELADVDGGCLDPTTVADRLDVSKVQAADAVERLLRLRLLERAAGGLRTTTAETYAPPGVADRSKRRFLSQLGAKGLAALETQAYESREYSSDLFAIGEDDFPELRRLVKEFRAGLARLATKPGKKARVYCANVQVFEIGR